MANDDGLDLLGIGNAIVDVLSQSDDAFLAAHGLPKGGMTLIDAQRARDLYRDMGPGIEVSGGSCANTMAAAASLGAEVAYVGKVHDDELGVIFAHDLRAAGVRFDTPAAADGPATARCLIMVTPDGQRTMCTYLGACVELGPEDVDADLVAQAEITYLEGYLWDPPHAKEAFRKAMAAAHGAGRRVALTLSDPFCVDRHREEFRALAAREVDVLFANQEEIVSLYEARSLDEAIAAVRADTALAVVTRSAEGSLIVTEDRVHEVPAEPVAEVVDTTGAGDLYAAGFLVGLTQGQELPVCGRLGAIAAAEVISHFGARPEAPLRELVRPALAERLA
jgi:sugar/nucleoside kinase (ribokinase family)